MFHALSTDGCCKLLALEERGGLLAAVESGFAGVRIVGTAASKAEEARSLPYKPCR